MAPTRLEAFQHFQEISLRDVEAELRRGERDDALRQLLGEGLFDNLKQVATSIRAHFIGDDERPVVVLIPGMMGSNLRNTQGDVGLIWFNPLALARGRLSLIKVAPDGTSANPDVNIVASGLLPIPYLPLHLHLQMLGFEVKDFPYDWRQSPEQSAASLHTFLRRRFARTPRPVHLVSHSLGCVVARTYCQHFPDDARRHVAQVIMLGPPNYGSFETVRNLTEGGNVIRLVGYLNDENEPLTFARGLAGLYALLPAPPTTYPPDASLPYPFATNFDIYEQRAYRSAEVDADSLTNAQIRYSRLPDAPLAVPINILMGTNLPTVVGVRVVRTADGSIDFNFEEQTTEDGDGTVPIASAVALPGAHSFFIRGAEHGTMPLHARVRNAIEALVAGKQTELPTSPIPRDLPSDEDIADMVNVPPVPLPGTLKTPDIEAIAGRIRRNQATLTDLAMLCKPF